MTIKRHYNWIIWFVTLAAAICLVADSTLLAMAQDKLDEVISGFDQPSEESGKKNKQGLERRLPEWLDLTGSVGLAGSFDLCSHRAPPEKIDLKGLSKLRTEIDLQADLKLPSSWRARVAGHGFYDWIFLIRGQDNFTNEILDESEYEIEFDEVYVLGSLSESIDLKIGRQIVAWGTSESLRVVDMLNPLDQREPGMVDIEDLRLPVTMTRLDYYLNNSWSITGVAVQEIRFNKEPPYGSDFYPWDAPPPEEEIPNPGFSLKDQEFALAVTGRLTGWDVSLNGAWLYDDYWHLEKDEQGSVMRQHSRLAMVGGTVHVAMGNWLLKAETAFLDGLEYFNLPDEKKSRLDILAGVEYLGFKDTAITLEAVNRHLFDYDECLRNSPDEMRENEFRSALRITRDSLNDTLHFTFVGSGIGPLCEDGSFERAQIEYDWSDGLSVTLGAIFYQGGDKGYFDSIKDNDRIFLKFEYSF